jgi:hypothetical protein
MNSLSWLIYLADVADSLGSTLTVTLVVGCFAAASRLFVGFVRAAETNNKIYWAEACRAVGKPLAVLVLPLVILLAAIPSSGTLYAIAASELGETALKSEAGGKAVQALNAWLDRQIAGEQAVR